MIPRSRQAELEPLLAEQIAYYRASTPEYTSTAIPDASQRELSAAWQEGVAMTALPSEQ